MIYAYQNPNTDFSERGAFFIENRISNIFNGAIIGNETDIILFHSTDVNTPNLFKNFNGWKIAYSGENTQALTLDIDKTKKIVKIFSWSTILDNYDEFKRQIEAGSDIYEAVNVLLGVDKELEIFLKPFISLSPFALQNDEVKYNGKFITVEKAKEQLQTHVNKLLLKQ